MITEEDRRFKHLEKKIGFFVAIAIAGFLAVIVFIGMDNDLFTPKYRLKFTVEKGTGFSRGMPVKLSGFRIGRINSISLNEMARVDIEIQVGKAYQKWIKKDSVVKLVKEGLVGDSIIEVSVGTHNAEVLKDGAVITFEKTKGLEEVANDLADQVKPVLIEVKDIIGYVNDPNGDIKQSMKNIRKLTADLHSTREKVDALLTDSKQHVGRLTAGTEMLLKNTGDKINAIAPVLEKVDRSMTTVEQHLPQLLEKAATTMDHLDKTSRNLEKISGTVAPRVPVLLNSADGTLQGADTVVDALKDTWPLKNHVPVPRERELVPGDSNE
ncbi:MAG: MCE family protein [Proteobacteria bacterium]|nr:MCE family protein [Pseudomonadota bacterium]